MNKEFIIILIFALAHTNVNAQFFFRISGNKLKQPSYILGSLHTLPGSILDTIPEYLEMIRLKTAVLLATALQMGATVAGANEADIQHLYDFGINMGMSFQLQDDILDLYSDVAVFGKRHGGDIADNKKTYLYLKALELASEKDRKRLEHLFTLRMDHDEEEKIEEVQAIYDRLHVKEAVEQVMLDYDRMAIEALSAIDLPEEKKSTSALMPSCFREERNNAARNQKRPLIDSFLAKPRNEISGLFL